MPREEGNAILRQIACTRFGLTISSGLPTTRNLASSVNTSAFVGTNPTDEPIASGLPVIQPQSRIDPIESCRSISFRLLVRSRDSVFFMKHSATCDSQKLRSTPAVAPNPRSDRAEDLIVFPLWFSPDELG